MKPRLLFSALATLAIAAATTSCEKLPGNNNSRNTDFHVPPLTEANSIQLTFVAGGDRSVGLMMEGGKIAVDWGDGTPMTKDIHPERAATDGTNPRTLFDHAYAKTGEYTIKIWSEELVCFNVQFESNFGELRVGNCPALKTLWARNFARTKDLDLDGCPALESLSLSYWPKLERLALDACTELRAISLSYNPALAALDLGGKKNLVVVSCVGSALTELRLPENVETVECRDNRLTLLDGRECSFLKSLYCGGNPGLASIDLTGCDKLETVDISNTALAGFDFGAFPKLARVECRGLGLSSLDITANPDIRALDCSGNALASLDVSGQPAFMFLNIADNLLEKEALNDLFTALPTAVYPMRTRVMALPTPPPSEIVFAGNPGAESCDTGILADKGWIIHTE